MRVSAQMLGFETRYPTAHSNNVNMASSRRATHRVLSTILADSLGTVLGALLRHSGGHDTEPPALLRRITGSGRAKSSQPATADHEQDGKKILRHHLLSVRGFYGNRHPAMHLFPSFLHSRQGVSSISGCLSAKAYSFELPEIDE
jgi:hypothetical protein